MWVIKSNSLLHTVTVKNIHLPNYQLQLPSTSSIPNDYLIANNIRLFHCLILLGVSKKFISLLAIFDVIRAAFLGLHSEIT